MIKVNGVHLEINEKPILKDISFRVEKGHFAAILGPNGAGKTTLVKIILGLLKPSKGEIKLDGIPPKEFIKKRRGIVGYLPQRAIVNWGMPLKVIDVVLIEKITPFGFFKKYKKDEIDKAIHWLEKFGMKEKMDSYIKTLSGGEQQRVSIARCLINDPELLILDEPNTGIDAVYNVKIYEIIRELCNSKKITALMVTHDIGAITKYVDEIMCMNVKLHCHGKPSKVNYAKMLKIVYGEDMNIVIHGEQCNNCILGKGNDSNSH